MLLLQIGEIATIVAGINYVTRFLVEVHCTFAKSFNEHPNSLSLGTLICNTFIGSHPNFLPAEHLSLLLEWFTPFFCRHNSFCTVFWVISFYLSIYVVVLYQFAVTRIEKLAFKVDAWGLLAEKKRSRLRLCFLVVDDVPEKKGMGLWEQVSSSKCSFAFTVCRVFWPLNPSATTVYAQAAFYPSLRFTLSLQSAF